MRVFTKAPQISSSSATTTRSSLYETQSLHGCKSHRSGSRPHSARSTCRFLATRSACSSWSMDFLPPSSDSLFRELLYKRANIFGIVANAAALKKHGECVSCLGTAHAETALTRTECHYCSDMNLSSLCSRLVFFSESNSVPHALPAFFPPGSCEEKAAGQRISALGDE